MDLENEYINQLFNSVQGLPEDAIFKLNSEFQADTDDKKINVGIGAYRDENGLPWPLSVVREVEVELAADKSLNCEYLHFSGLKEFTEASVRLIFGETSRIVETKSYVSYQTISGTGALKLGAEFLYRCVTKDAPVLISNPSWILHKSLFIDVGFTNIIEYPYYDSQTKGLNFQGMLEIIGKAPKGSIVVLHACAHNPTGVDLKKEQWQELCKLVKARQLVPFFDLAYQGFASGSLEEDVGAINCFLSDFNEDVNDGVNGGFVVDLDHVPRLLVAQSYSKNMGIYAHRCGTLTITCGSRKSEIAAQLSHIQRHSISTPPVHGARIVTRILNDPRRKAQWLECLQTMTGRIKAMRQYLFTKLGELQTPGNWEHIINQIGMFSYTGLTVEQAREMKRRHIYMMETGRISVCGLNRDNINYFADSLDWVVRNVKN